MDVKLISSTKGEKRYITRFALVMRSTTLEGVLLIDNVQPLTDNELIQIITTTLLKDIRGIIF